MKTVSLLGAVIVDEAKAVAIINYCLFGSQPRKPTTLPRPKPQRRAKKARTPRPPLAPKPTKCPLDGFVFRKHEYPRAPAPQVTQPRPTVAKPLWQPRRGLSFPRSLCYLLAVQEHNWPSATVELGYYPTVTELLNSPLVEKFSTYLVEQEPGLYHMKERYVRGAITLFSAKSSWKVGASLPGRPHPGHNAGYPQRPLPPTRFQPPTGPRPPLPPQSALAPSVPLGVPAPKPWKKGKPKRKQGPFYPYAAPSAQRRPSSPAAQWKRALADPLDEAMDSLKAELDIFPSTLAVPAWKDMLAWLKDAKKQADFDRKESIPAVRAFFSTILAKVKSEYGAIQEDERMREETLTAESGKLVALLERFKQVEMTLENPTPGFDVDQARAASKELMHMVQDQEKVVDMLDGGANPADTEMGDDIADNASFIEVPDDAPPEKPHRPSAKELWPETNYQNYTERVAPLFPTAEGKIPLDSLFVKMEEPVDSKLYLPRPLELYTVDELAKVVPKGMSRWNNRYEDPMEPAKSWTWEEFSEVYNKPGFHFMLARVAQLGPQFKDPKLSTLRSKLATRWNCAVALQKMDPRQDWMLCTVPSDSDGEKDALKYDLIWLTEGNAVYVIRRFAPAGRARDLEWVVKGSLADEEAIYTQMRKRLLEFEMDDTRLGWRVLGVRKAGATSKFRGTFVLDSTAVYWPWSMTWGHKHGSVPESSPLLNFEPTWSARRPYACQCCYSTDHFTEECPLPFMKVGGNSLISHPARTLVIKKKAAERIIHLEKSSWELPVPKIPDTPLRIPASPSGLMTRPQRPTGPPPLTVVNEESERAATDDAISVDEDARMSVAAFPPHDDPPYGVVDNLIKFLMLQLHGNITEGMGLTEAKIQLLCKSHKGSLPAVLSSLRREGWLPASVSDQVMSFEYDRYLMGTPSPRPSGGY